MHKIMGLCLLFVFLSVSSVPVQLQKDVELENADKELIVLAAPPDGSRYYAKVTDNIFSFHIAYAKKILEQDDVLILTGKGQYEAYKKALGSKHVLMVEMEDIWMRDFSFSNVVDPVMFRYTAEGQGGDHKGQYDADAVQGIFALFAENSNMSFTETDFLNDGGNFVDDYFGNVVISKKFLRDNKLTITEGRAAVRNATRVKNIAFIEADEQGGLEHADGVVAFVSENTLVVNSYPEDKKYAADLHADLKAGLPDVEIHEIVTPYDGSKIHDKKFGSACGLYTNMLVTPKHIYLPQFGIPEDKIALEQIKGWTNKKIILVQSNKVCQMGGGVRCMSWQLRGKNAAVLRSFLAKPKNDGVR